MWSSAMISTRWRSCSWRHGRWHFLHSPPKPMSCSCLRFCDSFHRDCYSFPFLLIPSRCKIAMSEVIRINEHGCISCLLSFLHAFFGVCHSDASLPVAFNVSRHRKTAQHSSQHLDLHPVVQLRLTYIQCSAPRYTNLLIGHCCHEIV